MPLSEADTRSKLIDPAIHARGWTEDLIRREETAGAIELLDGRPRRRKTGRTDYTLRVKVEGGNQPVAVALIEAKAEDRPPGHGLEQGKLYGSSCKRSRRYLSLEHVQSHTGKIFDPSSQSFEDEVRSATFLFDSRHVLYGKLRPYLNKVALPDFEGRCTTELIPLLPSEDTDRGFLAWVLRRDETVVAAMSGKTGSRMPRANLSDLFSMRVAVPPLAEQRRIAAILDQQMAKVERAHAAAEQQALAIEALRHSLVGAALNGEL